MSSNYGTTSPFTDGPPKTVSGVNRSRVIIAILGALSFSLFVSVLVLANRDRDIKVEIDHVPMPICREQTCTISATDISSFMNTTVDPCEDFYNYTCDNWKSRYPANGSNVETSQLSLLQTRVFHTLSELLGALPESSKPRGIASFIYKSCVSDSKNDGKEDLLKLIDQFNSWPVLSNPESTPSENHSTIVDYSIQALLDYKLKIIFDFGVVPDLFKRAKFVLGVTKSQPTLNYWAKKRPRFNNYAKMQTIRDLVCFLNPDCGKLTHLDEDIQEMNDVNKAFEKISGSGMYSQGNYNKFSDVKKVTLKQLNEQAPLTIADRDWVQVVQNISSDITIDENYEVLAETTVVNDVIKVLSSKNIRAVKNWFVLKVILALGPTFSNVMRQDGIDDAMRCAQVVNNVMPYAAAEIYNIYWSRKPGKKEQIEKLIKEIKNDIGIFAVSSDWLDEDAKSWFVRKLEYLIPFVAYPDWILDENELSKYYHIEMDANFTYIDVSKALLALDWRREIGQLNDTLDRYKYWMRTDLLMVNAWYNPLVNSLTVPIGILDYPVMADVAQPRSVVFGIIGHIIAHEIFHGFDATGVMFDEQGQLSNHTFSDSVTQQYREKNKCLIDQYTSMGSNGTRTIEEDFPDNGAMNVVYKAFLESKLFYNDFLPNFNQTISKQFYISFASIWCTDILEEYIPLVMLNEHSLGRYRVNVPLRNSPQFSKVFECREGSFMNPEHKCRIF